MFGKRKINDFLNNTYENIEIESLFKDAYMMEKLAVQNAISYVANAISNSEFQVYKNNKQIKDDNYYHLNISANVNENATQFWTKVIMTMLLEGECLSFLYRDDMFVADNYVTDYKDLEGHNYQSITLNNSNKSFNKKAKDIFLFRMESVDYVKILFSALSKYGSLFSESCNDLLNSNAERWIYEVDSFEHGNDDFNKKWKEKISKNLKSFMESRKGVYPITKGRELKSLKSETKNISANDIINIRKDIFEVVANAYKMPLSMFTGNINNVEQVVNIFLTFCIDPIADMIGKELTRKLFTEEQYKAGCYVKVDTSCVNHYDLFSIADKADKLIAAGISNIDEIRSKVNLEEKDTSWSKQHWFTKNYGKIENILKEVMNNEK